MSYSIDFLHKNRRTPVNFGTWIGEQRRGVIAGRFLSLNDVMHSDIDLSEKYGYVGTDPRKPHDVLGAMWLQQRADGTATKDGLRRLQIARWLNLASFQKNVATNDPDSVALFAKYQACIPDAMRKSPELARQNVSPRNEADLGYVIAVHPAFPEAVRALGCLTALEYHGPGAFGTPNEPYDSLRYDSTIARGLLCATANFYLGEQNA